MELKIVIRGPGRSGKTSLINALRGQPFAPNTLPTKEIAVYKDEMLFNKRKDRAELVIWESPYPPLSVEESEPDTQAERIEEDSKKAKTMSPEEIIAEARKSVDVFSTTAGVIVTINESPTVQAKEPLEALKAFVHDVPDSIPVLVVITHSKIATSSPSPSPSRGTSPDTSSRSSKKLEVINPNKPTIHPSSLRTIPLYTLSRDLRAVRQGEGIGSAVWPCRLPSLACCRVDLSRGAGLHGVLEWLRVPFLLCKYKQLKFELALVQINFEKAVRESSAREMDEGDILVFSASSSEDSEDHTHESAEDGAKDMIDEKMGAMLDIP
ncbi:hypothetical protein ADUPG1_008124, partial [Aduncisulcus paluster]